MKSITPEKFILFHDTLIFFSSYVEMTKTQNMTLPQKDRRD
jgi:hypothetical protein